MIANSMARRIVVTPSVVTPIVADLQADRGSSRAAHRKAMELASGSKQAV